MESFSRQIFLIDLFHTIWHSIFNISNDHWTLMTIPWHLIYVYSLYIFIIYIVLKNYKHYSMWKKYKVWYIIEIFLEIMVSCHCEIIIVNRLLYYTKLELSAGLCIWKILCIILYYFTSYITHRISYYLNEDIKIYMNFWAAVNIT